MNKNSYSHILDRIAGDQVPQNMDLAPNILAQIQKRKRIHMQSRTRLISATLLVVIVLVVLFYTVPGMAAAIGRWFGYVPGVGLVREGQVRVLANPVSVTREGVTVTVDQVVLDSERTVLVYTVEGIPNTAFVTGPLDQCPYATSLRLPDGSLLSSGPGGGSSWQTGYQHRFDYPPISAGVSDARLVISCLFSTRAGAAPGNWEIPLHFVPAPPDMTAFPVIEIPTSTAPAAAVAPSKSAADLATAEPSTKPVSMTLTLDRAVQMEDGYLIYATLHWQDTPFSSVEMIDPGSTLHLLDTNGQEMLYEYRYDEQTGISYNQRQTAFAIKTAPVQTPGPLTLVLDAVSVELPVKSSFGFDPGSNPKPGQSWTLDREINIDEYHLRVHTATATETGFSFEISTDGGITSAMLTDLAHPVKGGGGGGGGDQGSTFSYAINYNGNLPDGPLTITISSIGVRYIQPIQAQWTPPAASPRLLPTQPAACLTAASWSTAKAQKLPLPAGLTGRVLSNRLMDANSGKWSAFISNPDGSNPQEFEGAQDGSLSPDGTKLVYSVYGAGISIADLASGSTMPLPGTANGDFNPVWSPDGKHIVFNRGMGIFDLFMINPDGTNVRQLTFGGVQEWPVGWLPDGRLLYSVPGRENEHTIYQLDLETGASQVFPDDYLQSVSPDGKLMITTEKTFGDRWLTYISELDGSNRWLVADSSLWVLTPIWSPDGQWLMAGVSDTDSGSTIGALIDLRTCQVMPLPDLKGNFLSWAP